MKFLGRLFLWGLMALALTRAALPGTERHDNRERVEVDVIMRGESPGKWTARRAMVDKFDDARIIVCEEFKDKVEALCLVITTGEDPEAFVVPVRMLEEKT